MFNKSAIRVAAFLLLAANCCGQPLSFRHLNSQNGLSDNRVLAVCTDTSGLLWLSNGDGFYMFDGRLTTQFYGKRQGRETISGIHTMFCDSANRIWATDGQRVFLLDEQRRVLSVDRPPGTNHSAIQQLSFVNGKVWLIISNQVFIISFDPVSSTFSMQHLDWLDKIIDKEIVSQQQVLRAFTPAAKGQILLTATNKLVVVDPLTRTVQYRKELYNIWTACSWTDKQLVAGLQQGKLVVINTVTDRVEQEDIVTIDAGRDALATTIREVLPLPGGNIAVATDFGGIQLYSPEKRTFRHFQHDPINPETISENQVSGIYADKRGLLVGLTNNSGINYCDLFQKPANRFYYFADASQSVYDGYVNAIATAKDDRYWMGGSDRLICFDPSVGRSTFYPFTTVVGNMKAVVSPRRLEVKSVCIDSLHRVWAGSYGAGIGILDEKKGTYTRIDVTDSAVKRAGFISQYIHDLAVGEDGTVWACTGVGLFAIEPVSLRIRNIAAEPGLAELGQRINRMFIDSRRRIWLGTQAQGAYCWDRKKQVLLHFDAKDGLPSRHCTDFSEASGKIFIGTAAGVCIFTDSTGIQQIQLPVAAGEMYCNGLVTDEKGMVWVTGSAMTVLLPNNGDNPEVLDNTEIFGNVGPRNASHPVRWRSSLLFPAQKGICCFQPSGIPAAEALPPVTISQVNAADSVWYFAGHGSITLPHDQNNISCQYSTVNFFGNQNLIYQYRLKNFDKDWQTSYSTRQLRYNSLAPGRYQLQVRVSRDGKTWRESANTIDLSIQPAFWQTWWSKLALVMFGGYVLCVLFLRFQRRIKSQQILNKFATSLYGQNTVEGIFWSAAKDCVQLFGFNDCVIYQLDEKRNVLVQKAAYGPKNPGPFEIANPIEIPVGKGIVGHVAATGIAERIGNTTKDSRYIVDDARRLSELAVPVMVRNAVFAVIDTEHPTRGFYSRWHQQMLIEMARICAQKIELQVVQDRIRTKIARDLHDDIGSALSGINIISKIALDKKTGQDDTRQLLSRIQENSALTMESMADIVWAINPENDTIEKVISRMKEFAADLLEPLDIRYTFEETGKVQEMKLDLNQRKDIYLLFKEAVNNAAKYSGCTAVKTAISLENGMVTMEITDNGAGFDRAGSRQGNGLVNMEERAKEMGGQFEIDSTPGKGTIVRLRVRSHTQGR